MHWNVMWNEPIGWYLRLQYLKTICLHNITYLNHKIYRPYIKQKRLLLSLEPGSHCRLPFGNQTVFFLNIPKRLKYFRSRTVFYGLIKILSGLVYRKGRLENRHSSHVGYSLYSFQCVAPMPFRLFRKRHVPVIQTMFFRLWL